MAMPGWEKRIAEAQLDTTVKLKGEDHPRIPYDGEKCHDCYVVKGQLHVPGCDMERCPVCQGQLFVCDCRGEDDDDDEDEG